MKKAMVILNETNTELIIYVRPDYKNKDGYTYMRFKKEETATAIYHAIKKASSLRYDFGHPSVIVEINGLPSSEMSCVDSTKIIIS